MVCFKRIIFQWQVHIHISVNKQWSSPSYIFAASVGHKAWIIHWEGFCYFCKLQYCFVLFVFKMVYKCGIHNGGHMWHSQRCTHDVAFTALLSWFLTQIKNPPDIMFCTQSPVIFIVASYNLLSYGICFIALRNILLNTELLVMIYNF